jgi:hypothetical protein
MIISLYHNIIMVQRGIMVTLCADRAQYVLGASSANSAGKRIGKLQSLCHFNKKCLFRRVS